MVPREEKWLRRADKVNFLIKIIYFYHKNRRNGDHFEGHWVNDKREGQGSYFFNQKNQVFVGEWVDDMPKAGVYSEVEDPENPRPERFFILTFNKIIKIYINMYFFV